MRSNIRTILAASVAGAAMIAASAASCRRRQDRLPRRLHRPDRNAGAADPRGRQARGRSRSTSRAASSTASSSWCRAISTCADATAASNAADRMVNAEKVTALVGPLCSGETIAAANSAAIPGNVVIVSPAATSPALTTSTTRTCCSARRRPTPTAATCLPHLLKTKGHDNIAITYVNNDYGKGFADALKAASRRKAARSRPRKRMRTARPTTAPKSARSRRRAPRCWSCSPMSTAPARPSSARRSKAATSPSSPAATA